MIRENVIIDTDPGQDDVPDHRGENQRRGSMSQKTFGRSGAEINMVAHRAPPLFQRRQIAKQMS